MQGDDRRAPERGRAEPRQTIRTIAAELDRHDVLRQVKDTVVSVLEASLAAEDVVEYLTGEPAETISAQQLAGLADDELRRARITGEAHRAVLQQPLLDAGAVSRLLGSRAASNPRQLANLLRRRGVLLGVPVRNRYLYPRFQFDPRRGRLHPVVADVNQLLAAATDPWGVASWWLAPNTLLARQPPQELVGTGADAERKVRMAAEAVVEPVG